MAFRTQVNTDSVQTLSNKTLTAPVLNGGVCGADPVAPLGIATKQYVEAVFATALPPGIQLPYGGLNAPSGWLLCDGSAVSRTTYAALFAAIGETYGAGDGSTTFNVPDKRGRVSVGAGTGSGLTARIRGTKSGEETHLLTAAESGLPAHAHQQTTSAEPGGAHTGSGGGSPVPMDVGSGSYDTPTGNRNTLNNAAQSAVSAHNNMPPFEVDTWIIKT